jgi:hypothetical protein
MSPTGDRDECGRVRTFKYVTHSQVEAYRAQGWVVVSLLGLPHSEYSVLMELPAWPEPKIKQAALECGPIDENGSPVAVIGSGCGTELSVRPDVHDDKGEAR